MRRCVLLVLVACGGGEDAGGGADAGLYHAIFAFDGSRCGVDGEDEAWCIAGDRCEDEARALCAPVLATCDSPLAEDVYDAVFDFNGRGCGARDGDDAWCKEGDRCVDEEAALCAVVLSPCLDMSTY